MNRLLCMEPNSSTLCTRFHETRHGTRLRTGRSPVLHMQNAGFSHLRVAARLGGTRARWFATHISAVGSDLQLMHLGQSQSVSFAANRVAAAIARESERGGQAAHKWAASLISEAYSITGSGNGTTGADLIVKVLTEAAASSEYGAAACVRLRGLALDISRKARSPGGSAKLAGARDAVIAVQAAAVASQIKPLLGQLFGRSALRLSEVTWETSTGRTLEQVAAAETVHPTDRLWRFRQRFGPGRRCFMLSHPNALADPLAILHVALTKTPAASMGDIHSAGSTTLLPRPMSSAHPAAGVAPRFPPLRAVSKLDQGTGSDDQADGGGVGTAAWACQPPVANFWSVGLAAPGLAGLATARHLIYAAAERLADDGDRAEGGVRTFVTLSPVPGFARWLLQRLHDSVASGGSTRALPPMDEETISELVRVSVEAQDSRIDAAVGLARTADGAAPDTARAPQLSAQCAAEAVLLRLLLRWQHAVARSSRGRMDQAASDLLRDAGVTPASGMSPEALRIVSRVTTRACAGYLVHSGWSQGTARAACPVSNFHSANGARLWRINWGANLCPKGVVESFGVMVNYRYRPELLETRAEEYESILRRGTESGGEGVHLPHEETVNELLRV